jgi:hypothetical protein
VKDAATWQQKLSTDLSLLPKWRATKTCIEILAQVC